jgi:hypothetical protein
MLARALPQDCTGVHPATPNIACFMYIVFLLFRARIFKCLWGPGIDSKEFRQPI